jgi:predicted metal-dependent phosphoesterase TrpH
VAAVIDLHLHSVFSDGSETPERICELAAEAGLSAIALTDHDGVGGIERARERAGELGLRFLPGCEVSCRTESGSLHMLCYFPYSSGGAAGSFGAELERLADDRTSRNERMAEKLVALGLPITYEEVLAEAGGRGVGRPHFAAVLVRNGAADSIQDAFDRYLGAGAPGYVHKARLSPHQALATINEAGALGVIAHPYSLGLDVSHLERLVADLAGAGLAGVECYYGRYSPEARADLVSLARRRGLVPTGGSDYHGAYKPDLSVGTGTGDLKVPDEVLDELEARLGPPIVSTPA